jgi:hypothetical protein
MQSDPGDPAVASHIPVGRVDSTTRVMVLMDLNMRLASCCMRMHPLPPPGIQDVALADGNP